MQPAQVPPSPGSAWRSTTQADPEAVLRSVSRDSTPMSVAASQVNRLLRRRRAGVSKSQTSTKHATADQQGLGPVPTDPDELQHLLRNEPTSGIAISWLMTQAARLGMDTIPHSELTELLDQSKRALQYLTLRFEEAGCDHIVEQLSNACAVHPPTGAVPAGLTFSGAVSEHRISPHIQAATLGCVL